MKVEFTGHCDAPPERVWAILTDAEAHLATLPSSLIDREVMADGTLAGTLTAGGLRERMVVRLVVERPGERLVAGRVNEGRAMRTSFDVAPAAGGSRIAVIADVDVPFLAQAFAREPIRRGLEEQVEAICRAASTAA